MRDDQAVWRDHLEAVQGNDPHVFLRLVERDGVLLGKVSERLSPEEQRTRRSILQYCERWRKEGGPHPDTRPPRPVDGDIWKLNQWRNDRSGHSELADWNDVWTKDLRGRWVAVLDRLAADSVHTALKRSEESGSTALMMPMKDTTLPPSSASRSLARSWSEAAAFMHAKSQEDLYKHLVHLSLHRESLEQLKTVAACVVREGRGHDLPALHQIVGAVNELLLLEGREKVLSRLPPALPSPPMGATLLGSATSIHPRWLYRKTHDYMLADRDDEFRDRKTRAVRQLVEMLPKAESEVRTVATALDLGVSVDQVSAVPTGDPTVELEAPTVTEMDQAPKGQLTFGEALAALKENLKQEQRAERAHDYACVELRRGYSGYDAPKPTSPHHAFWVQQHAAMASAKGESQAAIEARPALVRLIVDAARRLAGRADKAPEGLRASALKLAVDLDHCEPEYVVAAVDDALRRLSRDVEALASVADAAPASDGSTTVVSTSTQVTIQDTADEVCSPGHLPTAPARLPEIDPVLVSPTAEDTLSKDPENAHLLVGWKAILAEMDMEDTRSNQVKIKRLTEKYKGPINWDARPVRVLRGKLWAWLQIVEKATTPTIAPASAPDAQVELNSPPEMRDRGFQPKKRPNNQGTLSKKNDPIP